MVEMLSRVHLVRQEGRLAPKVEEVLQYISVASLEYSVRTHSHASVLPKFGNF